MQLPFVSRQALERFKWVLYLSIPAWFGYGLARDPANLDAIKEWFPTKAGDPQGDFGRQLPTLEQEYRRVRLEQAIDAELERLALRKQQQANGGGGGS
ncbi:hypothetical protein MNEG_5825 [Monoraphidium neglectum]|uniref:Uncharacterized protein n=1 Tax=Monoraphidium neglectum TaxID=145388 RepID=A0A0D2MNR0_9CHLO|nr:hypothetical protein MNEG_5825 [Monoraphidium neglectum]KIZ02137.1 hypothetical protein MNEG_5825 [Monoraphidium neglectum]|eukprot:XP_013901156.1 hypothetical protein MNEG_5825 [Monoraphidium neglectum]